MIAVGLLACVAAALLTTGKGSGESASLEWVKRGAAADSKPVAVPGGGSMQLIEARSSRPAPTSAATRCSGWRPRCGSTPGPRSAMPTFSAGPKPARRTEIARSAEGLRALYPRSSESGIYSQNVPERLVMDFSARGGENVVVEAEDLRILGFTTEQGVKLEWTEYEGGTEGLKYFIAGGKPKQDLDLPFFTIWKTTAAPCRHRLLHGHDQRREVDRRARWRAEEDAAADRRRSRRRSRRTGQ